MAAFVKRPFSIPQARDGAVAPTTTTHRGVGTRYDLIRSFFVTLSQPETTAAIAGAAFASQMLNQPSFNSAAIAVGIVSAIALQRAVFG